MRGASYQPRPNSHVTMNASWGPQPIRATCHWINVSGSSGPSPGSQQRLRRSSGVGRSDPLRVWEHEPARANWDVDPVGDLRPRPVHCGAFPPGDQRLEGSAVSVQRTCCRGRSARISISWRGLLSLRHGYADVLGRRTAGVAVPLGEPDRGAAADGRGACSPTVSFGVPAR
jgi:hypothetical protein